MPLKNEEVCTDMNDVILNKTATIERCVKRIHEVYEDNPQNLLDYTKQDSIILNIQRACEACIDLAMYIVNVKKLGITKSTREAFQLLHDAHIINSDLEKTLMNMVGFRNIPVHDYQKLDLEILETIINKHLDDFKEFSKVVLQLNLDKN